jgi:hypothetical protein
MRDPKRRPWASLHEANDLHPPPLVEGAHPCVGCAAACCWVVQLQRSVPETIIELEFIKYVLGFRSIEVGIDSKGTWIVNYRAPCRHLTPEMRCELHGTPDKPLVCQRYDEHNCMYREAFLGGHKASYLRLDLRRFEILQGMLTFDGAGMVADTPTREEMLRAFTEVEARGPEPASDPWPPEGMLVPLKRLERNVRWSRETGRPTGELPHVAKQALTYAEAAETPCSRCAAPCCQLLVFDFGTPQHVTSVDFMEYMLGFPGLELALTTGGWKTLVHTECQHFDEERCARSGGAPSGR